MGRDTDARCGRLRRTHALTSHDSLGQPRISRLGHTHTAACPSAQRQRGSRPATETAVARRRCRPSCADCESPERVRGTQQDRATQAGERRQRQALPQSRFGSRSLVAALSLCLSHRGLAALPGHCQRGAPRVVRGHVAAACTCLSLCGDKHAAVEGLSTSAVHHAHTHAGTQADSQVGALTSKHADRLSGRDGGLKTFKRNA